MQGILPYFGMGMGQYGSGFDAPRGESTGIWTEWITESEIPTIESRLLFIR